MSTTFRLNKFIFKVHPDVITTKNSFVFIEPNQFHFL